MTLYRVQLFKTDHRGERAIFDERLSQDAMHRWVGRLALEYGTAHDRIDFFEFTGRYQSAGGDYLGHSARLFIELLPES